MSVSASPEESKAPASAARSTSSQRDPTAATSGATPAYLIVATDIVLRCWRCCGVLEVYNDAYSSRPSPRAPASRGGAGGAGPRRGNRRRCRSSPRQGPTTSPAAAASAGRCRWRFSDTPAIARSGQGRASTSRRRGSARRAGRRRPETRCSAPRPDCGDVWLQAQPSTPSGRPRRETDSFPPSRKRKRAPNDPAGRALGLQQADVRATNGVETGAARKASP